MSLSALLSSVEARRKTFVVYAPTETDLAAQFAARNVTVEHRRLPPTASDGFVVVREDGRFRGAISVADLRVLLEPPVHRPWDLEAVQSGYRALFEVLEDTLFASLDRRQLLAASRELEEAARRFGRGTLRVGFQSPSAFREQRSIYARLVEETDLDVHVYFRTDEQRAGPPGMTIHADPADRLGHFWFLAFDGDGDDRRTFALVAEQRGPEEYAGFWTYDPELVEAALTAVEDAGR